MHVFHCASLGGLLQSHGGSRSVFNAPLPAPGPLIENVTLVAPSLPLTFTRHCPAFRVPRTVCPSRGLANEALNSGPANTPAAQSTSTPTTRVRSTPAP